MRKRRPVFSSTPRIRSVDLFAGCGGLSVGIAEAARRMGYGLDVRLALDMDAQALEVFANNLPISATSTEKVENIFDGELGAFTTGAENEIAKKVGKIDLLVGGPPCQGHSDLNNHTRRSDPRNALYSRMARAAEVLSPKVVVIENVPQVRRDRSGVVAATVEALVNAGYECSERIIDMTEIGVPQSRRRHILLADATGDIDTEEMLAGLASACGDQRSVAWAIRDLQKMHRITEFDSTGAASQENKRRINWLFDNKAHDLPNSERPTCHRGDHSYGSMYGRLWWDRPAQTVTTGFGSMGQGRYVHPGSRRTITPHEAARLQTFPDWFTFGNNQRGKIAKMIGNAVPPMLMVRLGEAILSELAMDERISKSVGNAAAAAS